MSAKKSGRRKNAIIVSVIMVLILLLVVALIVGLIVTLIKGSSGSSSDISASSVSEVESEVESDVSSEEPQSSQTPSVVPPVSTVSTASTAPVTDEKICYLTFDDGPSENTPQILNILKEHNATATFFVVGTAANYYHDNLKMIVDQGHTVALHAYEHEYDVIYKSDEAYFDDLYKIQQVVYNWTGVKSNILRFPGGSSNKVSIQFNKGIMSRITKSVQEKGFYYFDWNADSNDATGHNVPVETLMAHVKAECTGKQVCLLMHDTGSLKRTTVEALPQIIEYLRSQGYTFKGLSAESNGFHHGINN